MSNELVDSKKKSASEAFVNSFGGYPIGYGVGILILASLYWMDPGRPIHGKHCNNWSICCSIICKIIFLEKDI